MYFHLKTKDPRTTRYSYFYFFSPHWFSCCPWSRKQRRILHSRIKPYLILSIVPLWMSTLNVVNCALEHALEHALRRWPCSQSSEEKSTHLHKASYLKLRGVGALGTHLSFLFSQANERPVVQTCAPYTAGVLMFQVYPSLVCGSMKSKDTTASLARPCSTM